MGYVSFGRALVFFFQCVVLSRFVHFWKHTSTGRITEAELECWGLRNEKDDGRIFALFLFPRLFSKLLHSYPRLLCAASGWASEVGVWVCLVVAAQQQQTIFSMFPRNDALD